MFRLIRQVSVIFVFKKKSFKYFLNPERKQVYSHERSVKEVPKKESHQCSDEATKRDKRTVKIPGNSRGYCQQDKNQPQRLLLSSTAQRAFSLCEQNTLFQILLDIALCKKKVNSANFILHAVRILKMKQFKRKKKWISKF